MEKLESSVDEERGGSPFRTGRLPTHLLLLNHLLLNHLLLNHLLFKRNGPTSLPRRPEGKGIT